MAVRSPHSRRLVNATRTAAPVSSECRIAEALEDRTLLSATTELIDISQLPAEDSVDVVAEESIDRTKVETISLEGLVASYLEAQLAFAETADWESSVEARDLFGEFRLTALAFIGKDGVPLDQTDEGTSPYYEVVSAIPLNPIEKQPDAKGDLEPTETRDPESQEKILDVAGVSPRRPSPRSLTATDAARAISSRSWSIKCPFRASLRLAMVRC